MNRHWSDSLNPVLVKELRQSLRSYSFVLSLLGVQTALICFAFAETFRLELYGSENLREFFLLGWGVYFLAIVPCQSLNLLQGEYKGGTLEQMLITGIRPDRIAFGKWLSILSQTLILISSVIPYLLVSYLIGGEELFQDIAYLGIIYTFSMPLSALAMCLSGVKKPLQAVRMGIIIIVVACCTFPLISVLMMFIISFPIPTLFVLIGPSVAIAHFILQVSGTSHQSVLTAGSRAIRRQEIQSK